MERIISCCGVECSNCNYYPNECTGCPTIKGKPYWIQYTGDSICDIYDCCINKNVFVHCGQCKNLPCQRYDRSDPTKTPEENEKIRRDQLKQLQTM